LTEHVRQVADSAFANHPITFRNLIMSCFPFSQISSHCNGIKPWQEPLNSSFLLRICWVR